MNINSIPPRLTSLILLLLAISFNAYAQTGTIKGKVTNGTNTPLADINITLEGNHHGAATEADGRYQINKIPAGNYILVASGIGFKTQKEELTVEAGETYTVNFALHLANEQLQEVYVEDEQTNKFSDKETKYVARMPIKDLENPQVYSVVSPEILEEQVVTNFDDALRNTAGLISGGHSPGTRSTSYLRGFSQQAFFRNGKMLGTWTENDMANIERIEIIKGPSAALFGGHGRANYGGVINRVTEKPYARFGGNVNLVAGEYGYNRFTADVNSPVNSDSTVLTRINTAYRKQNSFQDYGWAESYFIAPVVTYNINERLQLVVEGELFKVKGTDRPLLSIANDITNIDQLDEIYDQSFTTNEIVYNKQATFVTADLIYELHKNWTSTTSYAFSHSDYDYDYVAGQVQSDTAMQRALGTARYDINFTNIQQNFNGDFQLGGMRNRLVIGFDYLQDNQIYVGARVPYDQINYHQVAPYISKENFESTLNTSFWSGGLTNDRYSTYVSNVLDVTRQLHLMASVRYEYAKDKRPDSMVPNQADEESSYNQGGWTPKLGAVFEIIPGELSVFGNYMGGTKNQNSYVRYNGSNDGELASAVPEKATQWEAGVKATLLSNKLSLTVSYFDITVDDKLRTDPSHPQFSLQDGTQENKGFEVELIANPITGLNMNAGYGYLDATFLNGGNEGNTPAFAPEHQLNYWISYAIPISSVKGLGVGLGGTYRSDTYLTDNNAVMNPAIHLVDATIFYDNPTFRIALKADNLTDEIYWGTGPIPQPPRSVRGSLTFKW